MPNRPPHYGAGKAVALLATCVVVLAGAVTCIFIGVTTGEDQARALLTAGGAFAGIVFLLWLLRDRQPKNSLAVGWGWLARRRRRKIEYRLAPRPRSTPPPEPLAPPSVESVRAARSGGNTWVPTRSNDECRSSNDE